MAKYYAVKKGRETGLFLDWETCEKQVKGYKGAIYKSFTNEKDALVYLEEQSVNQMQGLIAYVDGSYHKGVYGYGCVLIDNNTVIKKFYGKGDDSQYSTMHNVAGEIIGAMVAVQYAMQHHYTSMTLYYDYEGIEKWVTGQWQARKQKTQEYQEFMNKSQEKIMIQFIKVVAHSGDYYNDMADALAKKAVGLYE